MVDDFASMRRIVKGVLRQMGFNKIIEAEDGADALEVLQKEVIGLVLADWNMPKMTGIELLEAVRGDESLKDIPFMMVTAEGQKGNVVEAVQAGVSSYIVKPFTSEALEEKIKKVLN